jgi:hypothetical protein
MVSRRIRDGVEQRTEPGEKGRLWRGVDKQAAVLNL